MAFNDTLQRIKALTPITSIASLIGTRIDPVASQVVAVEKAVSMTLSADVTAPFDVPSDLTAASDGWAVTAEQTLDASYYAPVVLSSPPLWVNAGERMPQNTDAVLPADAAAPANATIEVYNPVASLEGVLPPGRHARKGGLLLRAGDRLTALRSASLRSLGISSVSVRAPRVKIVPVSAVSSAPDVISPVIARAVAACGGVPEIAGQASYESLLEHPDCDAIVVIGGTGSGKNDTAVQALVRKGALDFHGFGIAPGQTAAFGRAGNCPVLLLPGALDAALSVFLVVGSALMDRLSGHRDTKKGVPVALAKKIVSTIGMEEIVFVRRVEGRVEPLGKASFALQKLLLADGWIRIPADSEGVPEGASVEMRKLP